MEMEIINRDPLEALVVGSTSLLDGSRDFSTLPVYREYYVVANSTWFSAMIGG